MKKKIVLCLFAVLAIVSLSGCFFGAKRDINYLMSGYIRAYTKADLEAEKDIFPEFYLKANEAYVNQESLTKEMENAQKQFGEDFTITYKVEKETKMTDEELKEFNEKMKSKFEEASDASECYTYEGSVEFKGSVNSTTAKMETIARCNYNGKFYLIRK